MLRANPDTIFTISVILFIFLLITVNRYISIIKKKNKKFIFNPKILENFEIWLNGSIGLNITKYIEEILGSELKQEEELNLSVEFVQNGINIVCTNIISQMPIFYKNYMMSFYGEERLVMYIREKTRQVFVKFVENVVKKRSSEDYKLNKEEEVNTKII